ncbi:MAG: hypothetical protein AAB019_07265 [Planctomycetota bacterium]
MILSLLAVIIFFILRARDKQRLREMSKDDEWLNSLDNSEWGGNDEEEDDLTD